MVAAKSALRKAKRGAGLFKFLTLSLEVTGPVIKPATPAIIELAN